MEHMICMDSRELY